jgi:hypothetical protein
MKDFAMNTGNSTMRRSHFRVGLGLTEESTLELNASYTSDALSRASIIKSIFLPSIIHRVRAFSEGISHGNLLSEFFYELYWRRSR